MIAFLKGQLQEIHETHCTILIQAGIGYDVHINEVSYAKLIGETDVELYIYHHITEAQQSLFGFCSSDEKKVFTELIKISGVGGKVALNILSLGADKLAQAIAFEDKKTIESIKGIGKKMAEKIILELKDKDFLVISQKTEAKSSHNISSLTQSQIIDTLVNMGYSKDAIGTAMQNVPESMTQVDEILPFLIKNI